MRRSALRRFWWTRGIDAGFPFDGAAPGLGAYELGDGHEPIVPLNGGQN